MKFILIKKILFFLTVNVCLPTKNCQCTVIGSLESVPVLDLLKEICTHTGNVMLGFILFSIKKSKVLKRVYKLYCYLRGAK